MVSVLFCVNYCHLRLCYLAHLGSINDFCLSVCLSVWLWKESPIISVDVRMVSGDKVQHGPEKTWLDFGRLELDLHDIYAMQLSVQPISRADCASCKHLAVKPRWHDATCCQTGLTTGWTTGCIVYKHPTGCQTGSTTGCSIVQPVGQPVASCKQTSNLLSNRLHNWFDNRLNRVNT